MSILPEGQNSGGSKRTSLNLKDQKYLLKEKTKINHKLNSNKTSLDVPNVMMSMAEFTNEKTTPQAKKAYPHKNSYINTSKNSTKELPFIPEYSNNPFKTTNNSNINICVCVQSTTTTTTTTTITPTPKHSRNKSAFSSSMLIKSKEGINTNSNTNTITNTNSNNMNINKDKLINENTKFLNNGKGNGNKVNLSAGKKKSFFGKNEVKEFDQSKIIKPPKPMEIIFNNGEPVQPAEPVQFNFIQSMTLLNTIRDELIKNENENIDYLMLTNKEKEIPLDIDKLKSEKSHFFSTPYGVYTNFRHLNDDDKIKINKQIEDNSDNRIEHYKRLFGIINTSLSGITEDLATIQTQAISEKRQFMEQIIKDAKIEVEVEVDANKDLEDVQDEYEEKSEDCGNNNKRFSMIDNNNSNTINLKNFYKFNENEEKLEFTDFSNDRRNYISYNKKDDDDDEDDDDITLISEEDEDSCDFSEDNMLENATALPPKLANVNLLSDLQIKQMIKRETRKKLITAQTKKRFEENNRLKDTKSKKKLLVLKEMNDPQSHTTSSTTQNNINNINKKRDTKCKIF